MRNRILLLTILISACAGFAQSPRGDEARRSETIAPGVEHVEIKRGDFSAEPGKDRWTIHALVVDPQRARLRLAQAMDELVVFTPEFHRTTLTTPDGVEVTVERGRVAALNDAVGSLPIPRDGLVISASGKSREWALANLKRGMRIEIKTEINANPPIPFKPEFIIGAGPRLLASGKFVANDEAVNHSESLIQLRHPRTAIGWRADGKLILVTVDGRQPQKSVGLTIEELAKLMIELGCVEAMNLDGGGSTTMVIRNKVANSPSDQTGERPVSDALLVFTR